MGSVFAPDYTVLEGDWIYAKINRTGDTSGYAGIDLSFSPNSNISGGPSSQTIGRLQKYEHWDSGWWGDYSQIGDGPRIFEPGQTEVTVSFLAYADAFTEGTETLSLTIRDLGAIRSSRNYSYRGASTNWVKGNIYLQPITIEDSTFKIEILDRPTQSASFSISDSEIEEGRIGSVLVTRSGDNSTTQTVRVAVTGGTAKAGIDYKHIDSGQTVGNQTFTGTNNRLQTLFFNPGESSKSFELITYDNAASEADKTILISLEADSYRGNFPAQISDGFAVVTITDDDTASGGITVNGNNNGTINTGTINNTTNNSNSNNTTTVINNVVNNYYNSNNTTTNVNTWNTYKVDNSVKARDIVTQWFGNDTSIQQALSLSETKLLDIQASSWNDKVLIKSVGQASDNGGPLEAPQIDDLTSGNQGSVLNGAGGKDQIQAKAGWDVIDGGADDDFIRAGNGRDIITGGFGADELWGDFGWNTYKSEKDGSRDLIAIKSDQNLVNWLYGKAGNNPNGEKADIIEGLDSNDVIKIVGASTESLSFANASAHGLSGIGIYAGGALEALYTGGDLSLNQIRGMTSGDASAAAMNNSLSGYGVW